MVTLLLLWRPASRGHLAEISQHAHTFNETDQFIICTVLSCDPVITLTPPWSWAQPCFPRCVCAAASCSRATGRWWLCWCWAQSWRLGSAGCCSGRPPPAGGPPLAPRPAHSTDAIRLYTDKWGNITAQYSQRNTYKTLHSCFVRKAKVLILKTALSDCVSTWKKKLHFIQMII